MRIYLSSFLLGSDPSHLVRMAGKGACCALILNALDNAPDARAQFLVNQAADLSRLGFLVKELDLRDYFASANLLRQHFENIDLLWISGGNPFVLRKAFRQSGLDAILLALLSQDRILYAGFSAAAVIASSDLRGLTPSAASYEPLAGYADGLLWEGLRIVPDAIVVHHDSDHPGRHQAANEALYYSQNNIPHRLLRDGEAWVIDGDNQFIAGSPLRQDL